jgi:hypothetical protein
VRDDFDKHSFSGANFFRPPVLNGSVGAAIKIGVLGEMIEPLSRSIEAGGDEMPPSSVSRLSGIPAFACKPLDLNSDFSWSSPVI